MKTKIHSLLSACLLFTASLGLQTTLAQAQVTIVNETFEAPEWAIGNILTSTPTHGWLGNDNNGTNRSRITASPTDSPARVGSQSLRLTHGSTPNGSAEAKYALPETLSNGYIEFDFKYQSGTAFYLYMGSTQAGGNNNVILAMSSQISIIPLAASGAERQNVSFADAGWAFSDGWATFRITFDNDAKTLAVSINGENIPELSYDLSSEPAISPTFWANSIILRAGTGSNTGDAYFDNIKVVNNAIPEPSTVGLIMASAIAVLAFCRLRRSK